MSPDHLEAWRNYLVEQMNQRHGVAKEEAQKTVAQWLRTLGQSLAASKAAVTRGRRLPRRVGVYPPDRSIS
jgi:hypothetical protein